MNHVDPPSRQGILIFNLPDEQNAFEIAVKAIDYACAWNALCESIRQPLKYDANLSEEKSAALEEIRDLMVNLAIDYNLPELL